MTVTAQLGDQLGTFPHPESRKQPQLQPSSAAQAARGHTHSSSDCQPGVYAAIPPSGSPEHIFQMRKLKAGKDT